MRATIAPGTPGYLASRLARRRAEFSAAVVAILAARVEGTTMAADHHSDVYETFIRCLEGVDLAGLVRREPRIRRWLARQLDPETLDWLLPTLKETASTLGVNQETIRRYAEDPAIGLTVALPASAVRFHRHDLQVLVVQRAEREPAPGGLRRWIAPDTAASERVLAQALADGTYSALEAGAPAAAAAFALSSVRGGKSPAAWMAEAITRERVRGGWRPEGEDSPEDEEEMDAALSVGRYADA